MEKYNIPDKINAFLDNCRDIKTVKPRESDTFQFAGLTYPELIAKQIKLLDLAKSASETAKKDLPINRKKYFISIARWLFLAQAIQIILEKKR